MVREHGSQGAHPLPKALHYGTHSAYVVGPEQFAFRPRLAIIVFMSVEDQNTLATPPPRFAEKAELFTVSVPALYMLPPTSPVGMALALMNPRSTVRLLRVSFAPLATWNTRTRKLPLMVMFALAPSMVSPAGSVMVGSCEPSVMVVSEEPPMHRCSDRGVRALDRGDRGSGRS